MKRILSILISLTLLVSIAFVGCTANGDSSDQSSQNSSSNSSSSDESETLETGIDLCRNGNTEYKVIVPTTRTNVIDYVAEDVVSFIKESTGATLKVEVDEGRYNQESKNISLGRTRAFQDSGIKADVKELKRDGYVIVRKGNNVYICGGEDFGTAFGCYEFLKHEIGFEPYAQDEIYLEKKDVLKVKDFDIKDIPDFEARTADGRFQFEPETGFRLRILSDYYFMPANLNGGSQDEWIPAPDHTLRQILSVDKYYSEHPDWFLGNNGFYSQLCLTNDEMIETFIAEIKECIKQKPNGKYVSVTQMDSAEWCSCEKCATERSQYLFSGYFIRFVNKLINGFTYTKDGETVEVQGVDAWVQENYPGREILYTTFAYGDTRKPPVDDAGNLIDESCRPNEKLYIRYAYLACYYHALDDPECSLNSESYRYIGQWRDIHNHFLIWDYAADYHNYMIFPNDLGALKTSLKIYKDMGVSHYFREFASGANVYPFAKMRLYVFAKLTWDLDYKTKDLTNDFMKAYYKVAEPYMTQLLNLLMNHYAVMDAQQNHGFHATNVMACTVENWPRNLIDQALNILDNALKACERVEDKELAQVLYDRVLEEKVCVSFLKLHNYSGYGYNSADLQAFVAALRKDVVQVNANCWKEFGLMDDYLKMYD